MERKAKHYSLSDMAYSYSLDETFKIIESVDIDELSILEIIGLHPATEYLNDVDYLNEKAKSRIESNSKKLTLIKDKLGKYFSNLLDSDFLNDIQQAKSEEGLLAHTYIEAFDYYTNDIQITWPSICFLLENHIVPIYLILEQKKIALHFSKQIKDYLLHEPEGIEYLVREYDEDNNTPKRNEYYLPSFSGEEIDLMVNNYLEYEYANLNIVECLMNHKNEPSTYNILPVTKVSIKKGYEELKKKLFDKGVVWSNDYNIRIDPSQEESAIHCKEDGYTVISFGGKWIVDNIDDKPTLLNNLIYVFELVDANLRFNYLPQENSGSGLTDLFDRKNKNEYGNMTFDGLDRLSDICFLAYYHFLANKKTPIEAVYEWFSNDYIEQEFGLSGFKITLPTNGHSTLIKCKNLFSEIDRLLKSYMIFQKYGSITDDIYSEENLCRFDQLKSLNGAKYIYPTKDRNLERIMHLLFSDQSMLNYVDRKKESKNFYELLKSNIVLFSEYREFSKRDLSFLKDNGVICIRNSGEINFTNAKLITILKEFYFKGYVDFRLLDDSFTETVSELEEKGWLKKSNSLFSKQEADYLDFYLNNSKFTNALALRNKYEHPVELNPSESDMFEHYIKGLKVLGLIIIKINDELCRKYLSKED